MFSIVKPFIFNFDPETAHDLAIKALKFNYLPKKMFEVEKNLYSKNISSIKLILLLIKKKLIIFSINSLD